MKMTSIENRGTTNGWRMPSDGKNSHGLWFMRSRKRDTCLTDMYQLRSMHWPSMVSLICMVMKRNDLITRTWHRSCCSGSFQKWNTSIYASPSVTFVAGETKINYMAVQVWQAYSMWDTNARFMHLTSHDPFSASKCEKLGFQYEKCCKNKPFLASLWKNWTYDRLKLWTTVLILSSCLFIVLYLRYKIHKIIFLINSFPLPWPKSSWRPIFYFTLINSFPLPWPRSSWSPTCTSNDSTFNLINSS